MNDSAPAELPYYDRSMGLIIFGILTIGLGGLTALLCVLMLAGAVVQTTTTHVPLASIVPAVVMYASLAVALVWLGIGSILAKRWARALLLIFSWSWLIMGIVVMVVMAILLPQVLGNMSTMQGTRAAPTTAALGVILGIEFVIFGFLFIVLPAIWTFFYSSRHVKGTVDWRDPQLGWTDACPLPVLGFCLWILFSALSVLAMVFTSNGVAPFFGVFITGLAGRTYYVGLAALWFIASGLLYRVDVRGWWLILVAFVTFVTSGMVTYLNHDVFEMYRLMDFPPEQIDQIRKTGVLTGSNMVWLTGISLVPFLGYLFFIKRYFR